MTRLATAPPPRGRRPRAAAALLGLAAALATATASPPAAVAAAAQGGGHPAIACRCRANGHDYELGERACLRTPAGFRLAECRMVQNVTSWSVVGAAGEGCGVVSGLVAGPPRPPAGG